MVRNGKAGPPAQQLPNPPPSKPQQRKWYRVDLHLHTPASHDYEEPGVSYLEWMRTVVSRGLDIVAITDHNTVAGIGRIRQELEWLTRLEQDGRLNEEERARLNEWRDLGSKVLVLPGFEFTATFGFHILGLFPPETPMRQLEHVLLSLKVPYEKLDWGSTETGASTDVLTAYKIIREAGGLVIASHANSTHGVAMRNFAFGGQTKIAYTQDLNLDALEVTDLDKHRFSTARFFNGSKQEYPRRMHCIQGSDAHRLTGDPKNPKRLGIGERPTEMLLEAPSFEAIKLLLRSNQFDRTRRALPPDKPFDALEAAREEGPNILLSFHESANQRGGKLTAILNDICAFANTAGGTLFVGASPRKEKAKGLANPKEVEDDIRTGLADRLTPPLEVKIDTLQSGEAQVVRIRVPKGSERPYCLDDNKFYVRDETETSLAVRDEIVALVRDVLSEQGWRPRGGDSQERPGQSGRDRQSRRESKLAPANGGNPKEAPAVEPVATPGEGVIEGATVAGGEEAFYLPQIGVEIVEANERNGSRFYSIRDLRNGHVIHNVTRRGARKLWNYAIGQYEDHPVRPEKIQWRGNIGLLTVESRAGKVRYDLVRREGDRMRVFYGVTDEGMEGDWGAFVQEE
jgi:hypothetical protein